MRKLQAMSVPLRSPDRRKTGEPRSPIPTPTKKSEAHANQIHNQINPPNPHTLPATVSTKKSPARTEEIQRAANSLSQNIRRLRAQVIKAIEELRLPPDCPGPPDRGCSKDDVKRIQEEKAESEDPLQASRELGAFNPQFITSAIAAPRWSINQGCNREDSTPASFSLQTHYQGQLIERTQITMASVGAKSSGGVAAVPARMRKNKEIMGEASEEGEKTIIINMTSAREAARPRFLAVGLFLSTLLVSSDVLMDRMKRVWKVRGHTEASQIEADDGRKFVIEFSEEGDRRHAVRGGPWQYKMDIFLVEAMEPGVDPASVPFTHVPMWVQFRNIPFYLLTKALAWELGWKIGNTLMIDNNSRGNIADKFLRVRVQLPLYSALQKRIILEDEITGEEVKVHICYERLPNFCLFCGYIGHTEARCDLPVADRKIKFNQNMRVQAVHFEDRRAWLLPDAMGHAQPAPTPAAPWRATKPTPSPQVVIERVAEDVAKLNMADNNAITTIGDKGDAPESLVMVVAAEEKGGPEMEQAVEEGTMIANTNEAAKEVMTGQPIMALPSEASSNNKENKKWRRVERDDLEVQSNINNVVPLEHGDNKMKTQLGKVRPREDEEGAYKEPAGKKGHFLVPSLEACLSKEGLRRLREEEMRRLSNEDTDQGNGKEKQDEQRMVEDGGKIKAATGPGATGNLSGANDGARQEP